MVTPLRFASPIQSNFPLFRWPEMKRLWWSPRSTLFILQVKMQLMITNNKLQLLLLSSLINECSKSRDTVQRYTQLQKYNSVLTLHCTIYFFFHDSQKNQPVICSSLAFFSWYHFELSIGLNFLCEFTIYVQ